MALELYTASKHSRVYREVLPDGSRRGYMTSTLGPMNYESEMDSGEFDAPVNMHMERVSTAELDGYEMTNAGWHYRVQTVEPTDSNIQPNTQRPIGTVGFGGRQGSNWFHFKLTDLGVMNWSSRKFKSLGVADYSTDPVITEKTRNLGNVDEVPDDIQVNASSLDWHGICPNLGAVTLHWGLKSIKMKEDVIVSKAAREQIEALLPKNAKRQNHIGMHFEVDAEDIDHACVNGVQCDHDDFNDDEGAIEFNDGLERLLAFMPLDFVYVKGKGGKRPLRKRFYKENGKTYLFVGVSLKAYEGLLPGDIVFDPSITQEAIAATADDCYESGTSNDITPNYSNNILIGDYSGTTGSGGFRFTPPIPQGASLTGGGSEFATLRLYRNNTYSINGAPNAIFTGDDQDNAPAWQDGTGAERPTGTGFTPTTASTAITPSDPGANGQWNGGIDVAAIVEEIVGRAGWSSSNGMRFRGTDNQGLNDYWMAVEDFDGSNTEARFDAFYTTVGGGGLDIPVAMANYRRRHQGMV